MIELISFALFVLLIILCISIYQMTKDVAEIKIISYLVLLLVVIFSIHLTSCLLYEKT